jgi:hypothetical protein
MGWKTERVQDMASGIVVGGECGSLLHSDNTRPDIRTYARPRLGRVALAPAWGSRSIILIETQSRRPRSQSQRAARAQGKASHRPPPSLSHLRPSATTCLVSMQHAALLVCAQSFDTHKYSTVSPISPDTLHSLSLPQQPTCHRDEIPPAHSAGGYDRLLNPA